MATVEVPASRATMSESPDGLLITIPAKKNWLVILFLGFWLMGWLFGEVSVIHELIRGHSPNGENLRGSAPIAGNLFLLGWLGMWTLGGGFAAFVWLWNFAGVERVLLAPSTLATKRTVLGIGPLKEYELRNVSNLRIDAGRSNISDRRWPSQMMSGGRIAFDYGAKTYRFGVGLGESEAQQIVARLKSRHPF